MTRQRGRTGGRKPSGRTEGESPELTTRESELLKLVRDEGLSWRKAQQRLGVGNSWLKDLRRSLWKKGHIEKRGRTYLLPSETPSSGGMGGRNGPARRTWDVHGCKWRVEIIAGADGPRYRKLIGAGVSVADVRGCTVEFYEDVLLVHAALAFRGETPRDAVEQSWSYLWRVLSTIESDHNIILRKERHANIRRYAAHFANINDPHAQAPGGERIKVFGKDGKLRFMVDWSLGHVPEAEFPHATLAESDAEYWNRTLRETIEQKPPSSAEQWQMLSHLAKLTTANANALQDLLALIRPSREAPAELPEDKPDYFG